jgi:hypothetical protein
LAANGREGKVRTGADCAFSRTLVAACEGAPAVGRVRLITAAFSPERLCAEAEVNIPATNAVVNNNLIVLFIFFCWFVLSNLILFEKH